MCHVLLFKHLHTCPLCWLELPSACVSDHDDMTLVYTTLQSEFMNDSSGVPFTARVFHEPDQVLSTVV